MSKEEKYLLKCIKYFSEYEIIVYGDFAGRFRYIPITFKKIGSNKVILSDIKTWKELYKQKEYILSIIQGVGK